MQFIVAVQTQSSPLKRHTEHGHWRQHMHHPLLCCVPVSWFHSDMSAIISHDCNELDIISVQKALSRNRFLVQITCTALLGEKYLWSVQVYGKSCWVPPPGSAAGWTIYLSNAGNVSPEQDTNRMRQPPASCMHYLTPCHSFLVEDVHRKPVGLSHHLSHAKSIPVKCWWYFTSCKRLHFIAVPRREKSG